MGIEYCKYPDNMLICLRDTAGRLVGTISSVGTEKLGIVGRDAWRKVARLRSVGISACCPQQRGLSIHLSLVLVTGQFNSNLQQGPR